MNDQEIYQEENEISAERFELVLERIRQMKVMPDTPERFSDYFRRTAEFILLTVGVLKMQRQGLLDGRSMEECEDLNRRLYEDLMPDDGKNQTGYA